MDEVRYCEYKILLDAQRFRGLDDFRDFWRRTMAVAARCNVQVEGGIADGKPQVRFVTFYDTPSFDLYRNAFILRQRIGKEAGAKAELTFKFRHPEVEKARRVDVRSQLDGKADIKFKEEVLQPRDGSPGSRSVFSHNCVLHSERFDIPQRFDRLKAAFPGLATLQADEDAPILLVNNRTIEERQVETGVLDFGHGLMAKSSIAIWQDGGSGQDLTGEFSYQTKFDNLATVDERARDRAEHFHFKLQKLLVGWVSTGATKTSLIYGTGVGHE